MLVGKALDSVERERAMRHEVLAERVFDEIEEQLTELTEREEARPFLQYRFFYVPEGQVTDNPSLSRSPLSELPQEDWLLGWFQLDPGGGVTTPFEPEDEGLARTVGWSQDEAVTQRIQRLHEVASAVPVQPEDRRAPREIEEADDRWVAKTPLKRAKEKSLQKPKPESPGTDPEPTEEEVGAEDDGLTLLDSVRQEKEDTTRRRVKSIKGVGETKRSQSSDPYGIGSLNKGATRRGERQQRVTKSSAENVRSYQYPGDNQAILRGENALPEVEFSDETETAVAAVTLEPPAERPPGEADLIVEARTDSVPQGSVVGRRPAADSMPGEGDVANHNEELADNNQGLDGTVDVLDDLDLEAESGTLQTDTKRGQRAKKRTARNRAAPPPALRRPPVGSQEASVPEAPALEEVAEESESSREPIYAASENEGDITTTESNQDAARENASLSADNTREKGDSDLLAAPANAVTATQPSQSLEEPPASSQGQGELKRSIAPPLEPRRAPPRRPAITPPPPAGDAENGEVDVEISPFRGHRVDDETMLLYRTVRIGEVSYVQGLALLLPGLATWLEHEVLSGSEIQPFFQLAWNGRNVTSLGQDSPDFMFSHGFAAPFTALGVTSYIRALPEPRGSGRTWILQLTALLILVGSIGLFALWRMVSVVVHFAERRSNFVAAVSHELKTPLTAIRMYAEMLRDGYVLNEEKRDEYYETMATESERLSRLIQNVLELSRLEKGGSSGGVMVTGNVRPVLEEAVRVLERHARDRGFRVVLDVPAELPPVRYERDGLLQVLINLVDNGIKFSQDADPREVVIEATPRSGGLTLQIRDHGPGVPPRHLSRIFQPFYRGERELTRTTKGTGIGLALVKGLIADMGGSVSARNHPQGGFEVRVALVS